MANHNKVDGINRWLTLGANIGVVLGLIILIVEVRQNAALTRMSLEADNIGQYQALELRIADPVTSPIWVKSILEPEALTDAEIRTIDGLLASLLQQWWQLLLMENEGLVSHARIERQIRNQGPFAFGNVFAQRWWRLERDAWTGTRLIEIADPIISAVDPEFNKTRILALRAAATHAPETAAAAQEIDPVAVSAQENRE